MILCFGTFASTLRLAKLESIPDKVLLGTMPRSVDPNCQYIEKGNDTPVSRLYSCGGNFPNTELEPGLGLTRKTGETLSLVLPLARTKKKEDISEYFLGNVVPMLDEDKKQKAVLGLLDIIRHDSTLDNERALSFEKFVGIKKADLLNKKEIDLTDLLSGLFLYTVVCVKNRDGERCISDIDEIWFDNLSGAICVKDWIDAIVIEAESTAVNGIPAGSETLNQTIVHPIVMNFNGPVQNVNPNATTVTTNNYYYNGKEVKHDEQ